MFAATAAGIYPKVEDAMAAIGTGFDAEYFPNTAKVSLYALRYQRYDELGHFIEQQISQGKDRNQNQQTAPSPALSGI